MRRSPPLTHPSSNRVSLWKWVRSLHYRRVILVVRRSLQHRLPGLSAEIAYNAIFSLFPAILALLTAIGLLNLPETQLRDVLREFDGVIPGEATALVKIVIDELRGSSSQGLFSLSFAAAIWISSSVMGSMMSALDQIHGISRRQLRPFWKAKLVAIGLSLGTMVLLIGALVTVFMGEMGINLIARAIGSQQDSVGLPFFATTLLGLWQMLSLPMSLTIVGISLGFIYRYGPSRWHDQTPLAPGVLVATGLWAIVSGGLRFYVSTFGNYNQAYGAVGAVIILLLWLYLSAFAMLIGAEVNAVLESQLQRNNPAIRPRVHSKFINPKFITSKIKKSRVKSPKINNPIINNPRVSNPRVQKS